MKGVPFIAVFALSPFETFGLSAVEALAERTIALLSSGQLAQAGERTYRYATQQALVVRGDQRTAHYRPDRHPEEHF
jgi:hypothetical protein